MAIVSIVLFFLILGLLVYVHELGHFLAAKMVGVRVEEFAFGFGPRLVTLFRRSGTDYTIHALPMGGFVNLVGMQPEDEAVEGGLMSKSRPARAFVFLAGPLMNAVLAVAVFCGMGMVTGAHRDLSNYVKRVFPNTEAARVGLQPGDRILAVNGRPIHDGQEMLEAIESNPGREMRLSIGRFGHVLPVTATPRKEVVEEGGTKRPVGRLGFRPGENFSNEVQGFSEKSIAQRAGLMVGDRLVAANGRAIRSGDEMLAAIASHPGQRLDLVVLRNGERVPIQTTPEPVVLVAGPDVQKILALKLYPEEQIYAVNGRPVRSTQEAIQALEAGPQPAKVTVERNSKRTELTVPLTPSMVRAGFLSTEGRLGFMPGIAFERMGFSESVRTGMSELHKVLFLLYELVRRNKLKENTGGPIMMFKMVKHNTKFEPSYQVMLVGQLSLSLAIFNLMPIPVLDGGHLALLAVEALRRRRLDPAWHRAVTAVGLAVILLLFLLLTYSDVSNWGKPLIQ